MTYEDYSNLAAEMNILFRYIDDDLVEKIPQKIIEFFQDIASPTFHSKIDPRFPLEEQSLLPSTECMLTLLYRQYWASDEEREELDKILIENAQEQETNSSLNNIFDKIENSEELFVEETPQNFPATISKKNFVTILKNLLNKLTDFFKNLTSK
jgi:uncharacterized membrane protein YheB (UPF0754 family)